MEEAETADFDRVPNPSVVTGHLAVVTINVRPTYFRDQTPASGLKLDLFPHLDKDGTSSGQEPPMRTQAVFRKVRSWLPMLGCLILWGWPISAIAIDPAQLQQQGIDRVQEFIEHFRKTGDRQTRLPNLKRAAQELSRSLEIFTRQGRLGPAALSLVKLGDIYRMTDQHQEALTWYEQAQQMAQKADHAEHHAMALLGIARANMYGLRNYGAAATHIQAALPLTAGLEKKDLHVDALDYKAQVQIYQGDVIGAAATLNRALRMVGETEDETRLFYIYLDRADIYQKLGEQCDYRRAFKTCYDALDLSKADYEEARQLAGKLGWQGMAKEADGFLRRLTLRRQLIQSQETFQAQIREAEIFHPKKAGDVIVQDRFAAGSQAIPAGMLGLIQSSGATADAGDPRSLYIRGLFHEMQGDNDGALEAFLRAVDALERDRRDLQDEQSRGTFLEDKIDFYYPPMLHLLDRGQYAAAFNLLERSRSRAFADLLGSRTLTLADSLEHELFGQAMNLRAQIAVLQKDLFEKQNQPDREKFSKEITETETRIQRLEQEHDTVLQQMGTRVPRLKTLVSPPLPTLETIQRNLRQEQYEILEYLVQESQIVLWHIRGDAIQVKSVFLPRTEIIKKVGVLRNTLSDVNEDFDITTAQELFLFLIQPVLKDIHTEHLVIIPHDDLNHLPFQVLQDPKDQTFVGERFQISYAPSASILMELSGTEQLIDQQLFAIADPGIAVAPGEVTAIAALYPNRHQTVIDRLMSETEFKAQINGHDLVHISVHGTFNAQEPMLSYLQLQQDNDNDGRLTAAEMFGLPLKNTQLVVLSACATGRAKTTHANETLGMVRALVYAGAQTLILSSWEVDEDSTALWMKNFYLAAQSHSLGEAARQALVAVKSQYAHPYHWGAFSMIGK